MKTGRKLEYPEKTSDNELMKQPCSNVGRFEHQTRLEPVFQHWRQIGIVEVLTVTLSVAPGVDPGVICVFRQR